MLNRWGLKLILPLVCGFVASCAGGDRPREGAGAAGGAGQRMVTLSGCVEGAPGTNQYVLHRVQFAGQQTDAPGEGATTPVVPGITEGSWVRLNGGDRDRELRGYLGQRVTLTGAVTDSGANTVGTAGTAGEGMESGDKSRAAADESYPNKVADEAGRIGRQSMANGTAAEIKVSAVESTGERCE
ncbi:MAG: hypothetical protein ACRD15_00610 [Vicinamibacterales bacterium]